MSPLYSARRAIATALMPVLIVVGCVAALVRAFDVDLPAPRHAEEVNFPGDRWEVGYALPLDKVQVRCVITRWSEPPTGVMRPRALRVPKAARCDRRLVLR